MKKKVARDGSRTGRKQPPVRSLRTGRTGRTPMYEGKGKKGSKPKPDKQPVELATLLDELVAALSSHLILPSNAVVAIAGFIVLTYVYDFCFFLPILTILSVEKRCGKSTVNRMLVRLCLNAFCTSNITTAALFRFIAKYFPTIITDEADSFFEFRPELRGILDSGHTKETAYTVRCVGEDHDPEKFSTWCPKVIAAIGTLPATVMDRSIVVRMQRKKKSEQVKRIDSNTEKTCERLKELLLRWSKDNGKKLESINVEDISELDDRQNDNWRGMLTIASLAGDEWFQKMKKAAIALSAENQEIDNSPGIRLITYIKDIFDEKSKEHLFTTTLISGLRERGEFYNDMKLSKTLKPYIKHKSHTVHEKSNDAGAKGYDRWEFLDCWERYVDVSHTNPSRSSSPSVPTTKVERKPVRYPSEKLFALYNECALVVDSADQKQ